MSNYHVNTPILTRNFILHLLFNPERKLMLARRERIHSLCSYRHLRLFVVVHFRQGFIHRLNSLIYYNSYFREVTNEETGRLFSTYLYQSNCQFDDCYFHFSHSESHRNACAVNATRERTKETQQIIRIFIFKTIKYYCSIQLHIVRVRSAHTIFQNGPDG